LGTVTAFAVKKTDEATEHFPQESRFCEYKLCESSTGTWYTEVRCFPQFLHVTVRIVLYREITVPAPLKL
jgi:hypothetical protein